MSRTLSAFRSVIFGFILRLTTMICPFIVRIIITWTLGKEFLGVSGVFVSILSLLSLTELGFSSSISYKCYYLYARHDYEHLNAYLYFFRKIYRFIGFVIVILGVLLTPCLNLIVKDKLPNNLNIYIVFYIYLFDTAISYFIASYRTVILTVVQRQDIESKIAIICNVLAYAFQIVILVSLNNFYYFLIVLPISTILINLIRFYITNRFFSEFVPKGELSYEEKKDVFNSIKPLIGHRLQGLLVSSADNIVISIYLGVVMVAEYNNYYTVINSIMGFIIAFYAAVQPGIGNSMNTDSIEKNYNDFIKLSFGLVWSVGWISISLICLFQDFISFAYGFDSILPISTVLLLVLELYIWKTSDIIMLYRDVVGKWNGDTIIPYISGIFNLIVNIILVNLIGLNGVIISTLISFILFNIPYSLNVLCTCVFKKSVTDYLKRYFFNTFVIIIVGVITFILCSFIAIHNNIFCIMTKMFICVLVPNFLLWSFWRNKTEFLFFERKLIGIIRR